MNLIGEHTDYHEGFVLPMAIDRRVYVAASRRSDGRIVARSSDLADDVVLSPEDHQPSAAGAWHDYLRGIASGLVNASMMDTATTASPAREMRVPLDLGANLLIASDVPIGAGLASSAALEFAVARALCAVAGIEWVPFEMAQLAQRAERDFAGVHCGIMDQVATASGREGCAMLLDCRSLDLSYVPMPSDAVIVVMDTGVRRALASSEYNARRSSCDAALTAIQATEPGVRALRDVTPAMLDRVAASLDPESFRRARHVVEENRRPAAMVTALQHNLSDAGALMNASHASLRDLYEVSSTHLDIICESARAHPDCFGARMTGAGFGGCAIALVRAGAADAFIRAVQPRYEARTYKRSVFFGVRPGAAARVEPA